MLKKGATIRARILGWTVGSESQERPYTRTCGAAGTEKGAAWTADRGRSRDCIVRPGELNRMLYYGDNWESSI